MPKCSVDVMDCDDEATHKIVFDGSHDDTLLDSLERVTCENHIAWYRRHYAKDRGYEMEVHEL